MLSCERAVGVLAERLGSAPPAADERGDHTFELAGDLRLGVREIPGGDALIAWTEAAAAGTADDAEARAAGFLRLHLARLRHAAGIAVTSGDGGEFLLYARLRPDTEPEWLAGVAALLNEGEMTRKHFDFGSAAAGRTVGGGMGLFAGLPAFRVRP